MPNFKNLTERFGVESEDLGLDKPLINTSSFYENAVGEYSGLVSKFTTTYLNKEKKKCKRDEPGARLAFGNLRLIIFKDPEKQLIGNDLALPEEPYGRLVYSQFIPLTDNMQFRNVALLQDFTFNDIPEASIIQGKKGSEEVHLANLPLFIGAPIKFEIVINKSTKTGKEYRNIEGMELLDHSTLTKEMLEKRNQIVGTLETALQAYLERIKKDSKANETPSSEAENPDDFTDGLGDFD